jgi:hypothetical protein
MEARMAEESLGYFAETVRGTVEFSLVFGSRNRRLLRSLNAVPHVAVLGASAERAFVRHELENKLTISREPSPIALLIAPLDGIY